MSYNVFVSHSMKKKDLRFITEMVRQGQTKGIQCYVAERDPQYGKSLSQKIESAIRDCDCFVALWTKNGAHSGYVNQEIGLARGIGKLRIIIAEEGVDFTGFDIDNERIIIYRERPFEAINDLNIHLSNLKIKKEFIMVLGLFLIALLGLVFLLTTLKRSSESSAQQNSLQSKAAG